jgi:putative ABC transport system permease protein
VLAVTAAVGFTSGAFGFSEQLSRVLSPSSSTAQDLIPDGSVVLTARTGGLTTATALDDALTGRVRSMRDVLAATGTYDQPVSFRLTEDQQPDRPVQLRGLVMSSTFDPARWHVDVGRAPAGPDEVAVDPGGLVVSTAGLGDRVPLELPTGTRRVTIVGVLTATGAQAGSDGPAAVGEEAAAPPIDRSGDLTDDLDVAKVALASAHAVLDAQVAPELLGAVGKVDRIVVTPEPGVEPNDLAARLRGTLPSGVRVVATTDRSAVTQQTIGALDDGIRTATSGFAALTVAIAVLVVANVFGVLVGQRTRELGLLRALGATPAQVRRTVLGEGAALGALASVLGLGLGVVLSMAAAAAVGTGNIEVGVAVTTPMVVASVAVGLGVSVAGAVLPALRASRVPPLAAMSDARAGAERAPRLAPAAAGVVGGAVILWLATRGGGTLTAPRIAGAGVGALLLLSGVAMSTGSVVRPLVGLAERCVPRTRGIAARLGLGNARRQPARTAAAASTLMVGLALVAAVGTVGASARVAIDRQFRSTGSADLYIERRGLVRVDSDALFRHLGRATRRSAVAGA